MSKRIFFCLSLILCFCALVSIDVNGANPGESLRVEMYNSETADVCTNLAPRFKLVNTGETSLALKIIKLRYYYTIDSEPLPQSFNCDWSTVGSSNVIGTLNPLTNPFLDTDYYIEISFKEMAGNLSPGQSIEIQTRITKNDWTKYHQTNDYSFNPTATNYIEWSKVTAYLDNDLIWGTEPNGARPSPAPTPIVPINNNDYLHVNGNQIFDEKNQPVQITGIAWFGFETSNACYHGLWSARMEDVLDNIANLGFNVMRIPLCVQLVNEWRQNRKVFPTTINYYANPKLVDKDSLYILDTSIAYCKKIGLKVVFDMHRIHNHSQSATWWASQYTTADFEACWTWLTERYKNDDTLVGMDLFNEPHGKTYQELGAKWDNSTDDNNWKYEAEKVGNLILKINPHLLIFVEGNEIYPKEGYTYSDPDKNHYYSNWWGGCLRGVAKDPVQFNVPNQLVYSPHDYGASVYPQPWFYPGFNKDTLTRDVWRPNWFYIHEQNIAPILIGEWGGKLDGADNEQWMRSLASFIKENQLHFFFWCINPNSGDTGGILLDDWKTIDLKKYELVRPLLWQNAQGKFIGLDHQIPLGSNGINLP